MTCVRQRVFEQERRVNRCCRSLVHPLQSLVVDSQWALSFHGAAATSSRELP